MTTHSNHWTTDFYTLMYEVFKSTVTETAEMYQTQAQEVHQQLAYKPNHTLELGAGFGLFAKGFAPLTERMTTLDLIPEMVAFTKKHTPANVNALCGNFYSIELSDKFDAIVYLDGFGIGDDAEQLSLLKRIKSWLDPDGHALIDIYNATFWDRADGVKMALTDSVLRQYHYNKDNQRMIDTWWRRDEKDSKQTQSLKCYLPEQINALVKEAELHIEAYYPGATMDYETMTYSKQSSLKDCMTFRIKVTHLC